MSACAPAVDHGSTYRVAPTNPDVTGAVVVVVVVGAVVVVVVVGLSPDMSTKSEIVLVASTSPVRRLGYEGDLIRP